MSSPNALGLIVSHGSLAAGLCAAVRQIAGAEEDALQPLTNEGRGPEDLIAAVNALVGDGPVILFTDLPSGSCAFAARKIALTRPSTGVICAGRTCRSCWTSSFTGIYRSRSLSPV